jgi:hypothetical protein
MINDDAARNQINPFVVSDFSLPGSYSAPMAFDKEEPSPMCAVGVSAGDNGIGLCSEVIPNCPMKRMLEPIRDYDPDLWQVEVRKAKSKAAAAAAANGNYDIFTIVLLAILAYFLFQMFKR